MKVGFKVFGVALVALLAFYVLGFVATGGNLAIYKFWAPQMEDARRQVFEETQSYVHGKNQQISRLKIRYEQAEGDRRSALRMRILEEASTISEENLTRDNLSFINSLRRAR